MIASKGYASMEAQTTPAPWTFERKEVGDDDVLINIAFCGVCHTDIHLTRNEWGPGIFPMVPGHEIVGHIAATGKNVTKFKKGDRAAVGVMIDSCGHCKECDNGQEQFCQVSPVQTYNSKDHDGDPVYGGYSNNLVVKADFAHHVAANLDLAAVAPVLCAGITTYSPLKKWNVGKGHKLAVVGLGGLGHMAVKFGVAFGAEVTVLSTSPSKEKDAKDLGAHKFVVTKDEEQFKNVKGSFDFILDTVAADHDITPYIQSLAANGVFISVGMPVKPLKVSSFLLSGGNRTITGSGAGGLPETQEMLDFCAKHNIVADIELINVKDIATAYERILKNDVHYRFVIDMATL